MSETETTIKWELTKVEGDTGILRLDTTFAFYGEEFRDMLISIPGVDTVNAYGKYSARIKIARLFNPEEVHNVVSEVIRKYVEEKEDAGIVFPEADKTH